jgi:hypothetical protein
MRRTLVTISVAAAALLVALPVSGQLPGVQVEAPEGAVEGPDAVIRSQLAAFNAQNIEAMVANLSGEFAWFAVSSDAMTVELQGREAFRSSMRQYFAQVAGARAEIEELVVVGDFVTTRERSYWYVGDQEVSQAALAVYEVRSNLIHRVWYYPAFE